MKYLFPILLGFSSLCIQAAEPYPLKQGLLLFGYETLTLPAAETMGLAGMGLLFDLERNRMSRWYGGLSVYGAIDGQRGGFFTGGLSSGLTVPITAGIAADAGLFIGGGGDTFPRYIEEIYLVPDVGRMGVVGNVCSGGPPSCQPPWSGCSE